MQQSCTCLYVFYYSFHEFQKLFFFFFGPNIASTLFSHRMNPTHKIRIYYLLFNNIFPRWNIAFLSSQFYFLIIPRSQQLPLISHHLFWWWLAYGWNGKGLEWKWMFKRGGRQLWKLDTFGYTWHLHLFSWNFAIRQT